MTDHPHAQRIVALLRGVPLRVSSESALQAGIENTLMIAGVEYEREKALSPADRPDFLCLDVAIEAKVKYPKRTIYRQLERYAAHDRVNAIILVSGTALGMPAAINGKPVYVVSIGLAFL